MRQHELPFTGPATFFKAPHRPDAGRGEAHIGLLGVPYDAGASYRAGARFGPAALREATARYALPSEGFYDLETGQMRLAGARVLDVGDVDPVQNAAQETFDRITSVARRVRTVGRLPVFVGGDRSVSFALLRAYDDVPELHVVQLGAHLSYSDVRRGSRLTSDSAFRRAVEEVAGLKRVTSLGLRGPGAERSAVEAARARGHVLVTAQTLRDRPEEALAQLPERSAVYLCIDLSVLDPSVMPGVGDPEVGGLGYTETLRAIDAVVGRNRVVGADLTGLAPALDPTGRSALVAARLLLDLFALWWDPARMV